MIKDTIRSLAGRVYWASPHFLNQVAGRVLILMYHRVVPRAELDGPFVQPGMFVTPQTFERHLRFLGAHFQFLSFSQLLNRWEQGSLDAGVRYCTLTFDDGWLDNYLYAYPLLRAYGVPATVFLPTDFIGTDRWLWSDRLVRLLHAHGFRGTAAEWDSLIEQAKSLPEEARERFLRMSPEPGDRGLPQTRRFITWDEAREMSRHSIVFGAHSCSHAILTRVPPARLERELRHPLNVLAEQRVSSIPVLAYPNGDHDAAVVEAARSAGYRAAVTTTPGLEPSRPGDLFRLRRIGVHDDVSRSAPSLTLHIARQLWAA
jgi:peptidoglycan/xylan/chitin deacetylase (PgdA/CDA1 family)